MDSRDRHTDEELFQRIKKDDAKALKFLFEKYFSPLTRFAWTFVKDISGAEEVVSDIFLNVWVKRKNIEITSRVKTYLYTAVKNQSLNYLKKNRIHLEDIETVVEQIPASEWHAERLIMDAELEREVNRLLQQLPRQRRLIFRMSRLDGLSYKEIAEILSLSISTVQNQMVAAVKFLSRQSPHRRK